ncbi:amidohydrolase [Lutibaculum baratangense]|uniref:Exoenzymes regulatory protein AepA in lipid-linked oligosaccharide synthesis cluster n=1 Tax=Lutibaculum baratangense AMV1 TaxID=631454 RepID=V4RII0_9HYPH|nr:amidohydrolase [Lutibaculum baratangense]ESR23090.1 Exoenzymes regulatory protein AepA in lipid-linked oligosaccharide synthesis cluster [Lutibaculum baratangense AMV1]
MTTPADLVVTNARVITMDDETPRAEAVAISGNRIVAVGSDEEIAALAGPDTRRLDAGGQTVLPGFNEAHMHLFTGAAELPHLHLHGVHGFEALSRAVTDYATAHPDERLLIGQSADYTILSDSEPVTRHHLDRILPDRPFIMYAPDHHTAWANTAALEAGGILKGRDVGVGSEIVMGEDGLAAGELREPPAIMPVARLSETGGRERLGLDTGGEPDPAPSPAERERDLQVLRDGLAYCARHGITSIQNMDGNLYLLELLEELHRQGELKARVRVPLHMKNFTPLEDLEKAVAWRERFADDMLRSDFVKVFMDGVLDSWTAVMLDDYADRPGWKGEPLFQQEHFDRLATEADRRGLQIAVHAIGDGAVRMVLDGYEAVREANGNRDSRHRIEHIEVVHPDDVSRLGSLGVVASVQPVHPPGSAGLPLQPTVSRIGEAKWPYAYAWKTLKDGGARMVFATDWPVSPIDPMHAIREALNRKPWKEGLPDHRPTLHEALASYTRESAWVEFMEDRKGKLAPGYLADLVVLSGDVEQAPVETLHEIRPVTTICDGRITYQA